MRRALAALLAAVGAAAALIIGGSGVATASAGDAAAQAPKAFLLTGAKPNKLFLVDPAARSVVRGYDIPGPGVAPSTIVPSPDGKVAYVLTNLLESVSGIDLDTGAEVFRADLSQPGLRVKGMFAMEISPDGRELYVFESPVALESDEYVVQDTRIAVFNTADGIGAREVRSFPAPRRIILMVAARDGATLWALGWDLYAIDPRTGQVKQTLKVLNWDRVNFGSPDVLDVWPQYEQSNILATPYFVVRTDLPPDDPDAAKTGLLTLDLRGGAFDMTDFEVSSAIIFSSVVSPTRPNEVFGVYTTLSKIDRQKHELVKRVDLPHTYYSINISDDGREVYTAGTMCDIGVHSTETLDRLATIELPGCPDQSLASLRVIHR